MSSMIIIRRFLYANNRIHYRRYERSIVVFLIIIVCWVTVVLLRGSFDSNNLISGHGDHTGSIPDIDENLLLQVQQQPVPFQLSHNATLLPLSSSSLLSPSSSLSCRRICTNHQYRKNIILLTNLPRAGWLDRCKIFDAVVQIAGYLCAQVWVPRPNLVLLPLHNQNQKLSINVTWDELSNFQFLHSSFDQTEHNNSLLGSTVAVTNNPLVDWQHKDNINLFPRSEDVLNDPRYYGWFHITTSTNDTIFTDFQRAEQFSWTNPNPRVGFIWRWNANYYHCRKILAKQLMGRQQLSTTIIPSWLLLTTTATTTNNDNEKERSKDTISSRDHHRTTTTTSYDVSATTTYPNLPNYQQWQQMQPYVISKMQFDANLSVGCQYSILRPPDHIRTIHSKIWKVIITEQAEESRPHYLLSSLRRCNDTTTNNKNYCNNKTVSFLVGHLHIRRNDVTTTCDTSLERISQYLNCSFGTLVSSSAWWLSLISSSLSYGKLYNNINNTKKLPSLIIVVLFSSDERDPNYRRSVFRLIEQQSDHFRNANTTATSDHNDGGDGGDDCRRDFDHRRHCAYYIRVVGIDLDKLITQILENDIQQGLIPAWRRNNFYIFAIIYFLQQNHSMIQFQLEQHRHFACPDCTNLSDQIGKKNEIIPNYRYLDA